LRNDLQWLIRSALTKVCSKLLQPLQVVSQFGFEDSLLTSDITMDMAEPTTGVVPEKSLQVAASLAQGQTTGSTELTYNIPTS
jgi:hypothetical protein